MRVALLTLLFAFMLPTVAAEEKLPPVKAGEILFRACQGQQPASGKKEKDPRWICEAAIELFIKGEHSYKHMVERPETYPRESRLGRVSTADLRKAGRDMSMLKDFCGLPPIETLKENMDRYRLMVVRWLRARMPESMAYENTPKIIADVFSHAGNCH